MQPPPVGPPVAFVPKMRLFFAGKKLLDMDTFSKSDPYCVLYHSHEGRRGGEIGRTETKMNDLNPVFEKGIIVDYLFEAKQEFEVVLYDEDEGGCDTKNDCLGEAQFQLSHIVGSRGHTKAYDLPKKGQVVITAVELSVNDKDKLEVQFAGKDLKKMDFFGSSDPYYKIFRVLPNNQRLLLVQSPHLSNTLNPLWFPQTLNVSQLAESDWTKKTIEFECWDKDFFSDDSMGSFRASLRELLEAKAKSSRFTLRKQNKPNKSYGDILVANARLIHIPTFQEYLGGGWQINLAVSIDFTGSNGPPNNPRSLHFMDPVKPNHYVRAIMSVGDILIQYDADKMVAAFGYGACLPDGRTHHFFHLNLTENPYVPGIQGVLDSYGRTLSTVRLSGPTNVAPTIRAVVDGARKAGAQQVYTVLLIITDGEITDMDDTIDAVVHADDAPLSIVIVRVGNDCDFQMMDVLDGDDQVLRDHSGKASRRDLVQFVPFKKFENGPPAALAAEVLREIPDQFVRWAEITHLDKQFLLQLEEQKRGQPAQPVV